MELAKECNTNYENLGICLSFYVITEIFFMSTERSQFKFNIIFFRQGLIMYTRLALNSCDSPASFLWVRRLSPCDTTLCSSFLFIKCSVTPYQVPSSYLFMEPADHYIIEFSCSNILRSLTKQVLLFRWHEILGAGHLN